jgi:hypothetical protein
MLEYLGALINYMYEAEVLLLTNQTEIKRNDLISVFRKSNIDCQDSKYNRQIDSSEVGKLRVDWIYEFSFDNDSCIIDFTELNFE